MSLCRRIRSLCITCVLLSVLAPIPGAFALSWDVHVVEVQPNPCWTSVTAGEWGIAVLYSDGLTTGSRLAWGGPDAWRFETLAPSSASGSWARCCTLPSGELFAVWYHTPLGHSLMAARGRPGSGWDVVSREFLGEMEERRDMGLGLALDPLGTPWVVVITRDTYYPNTGLPKLVSPTSKTIAADRIIDLEGRTKYSAGASCDIVIDTGGKMHFAYYRTDTMVLKYRNYPYHDNIWPKPRITGGSESLDGISLLSLADGSLAAFFKNNTSNIERRNLCCRIFSGDVWSESAILDSGADTGGFATSMKDRLGKLYVFYSGGVAGGVRMLTNRTGEWRSDVPDPFSVLGSRCAAALSGDAIVVSYWDALSRTIKLLHARNTPPSMPSGANPPDRSELAVVPEYLSWDACSDDESDGVSYSVYASDAKWKTDFLEDGAKILSGEAALSVDLPDSLRDSSSVFWRIVATDTYGAIREGATWSYEVLPSPTVAPTALPTSAPTVVPTGFSSPTPTTSVIPSATPSPTPLVTVIPVTPTRNPSPTSFPEPEPTWYPSVTATLVPSLSEKNVEPGTGCDALSVSFFLVVLLVPLLFRGPLDRK